MINKTEIIIKKGNIDIKMPKNIIIGDPQYFEDFINDKNKLNTLTYIKNLKGKKRWKGFVEITERSAIYEELNNIEVNFIDFDIYLANSEEFLNMLKEEECYIYQKLKRMDISVDTASVLFMINDKEYTISTGTDGCIGEVIEYYKGEILEGITLSFSFDGDLFSFKDMKEIAEYLFI